MSALDMIVCCTRILNKSINIICPATKANKGIPTRGNLFLPVRLLVWADGRGTVEQADSAARAELQGAPKQKLLQLKNIQKYHWVEHREMLICCFDVCPDM
jgi:hypothetical protein